MAVTNWLSALGNLIAGEDFTTIPLTVNGTTTTFGAILGPVYQTPITVPQITLTGLLLESALDNIVAFAGGGAGSATPLTMETNRVSTVATQGDSVKLMASAPGLTIFVINHGASSMNVFAAGTDTIDDLSTGVPQMINSEVIYTCVTAGKWYSNGLGTGYAGALPTVSFQNGIAAFATGGQAGGTPLSACLNRVTTVTTLGDSVRLMPAVGGLQITVSNAGAAGLNVFPNTGDAINGTAINTAFAVPAGKTVTFGSMVAGQWHAILSA